VRCGEFGQTARRQAAEGRPLIGREVLRLRTGCGHFGQLHHPVAVAARDHCVETLGIGQTDKALSGDSGFDIAQAEVPADLPAIVEIGAVIDAGIERLGLLGNLRDFRRAERVTGRHYAGHSIGEGAAVYPYEGVGGLREDVDFPRLRRRSAREVFGKEVVSTEEECPAGQRCRCIAALEPVVEWRSQVGEVGEIVNESAATDGEFLTGQASEEAARLEPAGRSATRPRIPRRATCTASPGCRKIAPGGEVRVAPDALTIRPARTKADAFEEAILADVIFGIEAQAVELAFIAGDAI